MPQISRLRSRDSPTAAKVCQLHPRNCGFKVRWLPVNSIWFYSQCGWQQWATVSKPKCGMVNRRLEAWSGPWVQPYQEDQWTSWSPTLSRKAGNIPATIYSVHTVQSSLLMSITLGWIISYAGNRDYCALATQGVSKRESVLAWLAACYHRALESINDRRLHADRGTNRCFRLL